MRSKHSSTTAAIMGVAVERPSYELASLGCSGKFGRFSLGPKGIFGQSGYKDFDAVLSSSARASMEPSMIMEVHRNQEPIQHYFHVVTTTPCLQSDQPRLEILSHTKPTGLQGKRSTLPQDYWFACNPLCQNILSPKYFLKYVRPCLNRRIFPGDSRDSMPTPLAGSRRFLIYSHIWLFISYFQKVLTFYHVYNKPESPQIFQN